MTKEEAFTGFDKLRRELSIVAHEISPWYDVDKCKATAVYIWSKDDPNDEEEPFGENVFDIHEDKIVFFVENHTIIPQAWPTIEKIQAKIREIREFAMENGVWAK